MSQGDEEGTGTAEPRPQGPAGSRVWGLDSQSAPQQAGEGSPHPQGHPQTWEWGEEVPPSEPPVPSALGAPFGRVSHPHAATEAAGPSHGSSPGTLQTRLSEGGALPCGGRSPGRRCPLEDTLGTV